MKKIKGMDITYKKSYKNAEMEIICEDDTLTTGKIYICGDFHKAYEIGGEDGLPNTKANINKVWESLMAEVDKKWDEDFAVIAR